MNAPSSSEALPSLRFDGKVAIVTGAGRGLGKAYANFLAQRGASVVVNDLGGELDATGASPRPADSTVGEIVGAGGQAVAHYDSIASATGATTLVECALDTFGSLDIVINNAGVLMVTPFEETDRTIVQRHIDVHVLGSILVSQASWAPLQRADAPRIVNVTSSGMLGIAGFSAYATAKAAIVGLTRTMAVEARGTRINVNAVAPSAVTRMVGADVDRPPSEDLREHMRRNASTDLAAAVVAYLCHSRCELSGEVLAAGGGRATRIVLAETHGLFDPELTLETIADRISTIVDDTSLITLGDAAARWSATAGTDETATT